VVCPAIEKNEEYVMRNVVDIYQGMQSLLGKKYNIALLHGKMHQEEKEAIMNDFVAGKIHFLISTTVIEVGVDVKNANIMVIYDAHRFGMSQIHQLRGRVGRGDQKGYCFLLSDSKDEDSIKRLELCASTSDGFQISQYDLQLRGPGDLLGTRQSGVPGFLLGDIVSDGNILEVARKDAQEILENIHDIAYLHIKKDLDMLLSQGAFID
jgi:ATP-dependent DNA helicase RecG